jgi:putative SOS response-associated peptidase YedK
MCYDIKTKLQAMLKRAEHNNDLKSIQEISEKLAPFLDAKLLESGYFAGFAHPNLLIYTQQSPTIPTVANWGLVPHWLKDPSRIESIKRSTLNAKSETLFTRSSFKESVANQRSILAIDGFFEHQHKKGKTYPFFIYTENHEPLYLATLHSKLNEIDNKLHSNSFSIVTEKGRGIMEDIHNNPKLDEPRMPVILSEKEIDIWLDPSLEKKDIEDFFKERKNAMVRIKAHTVRRLRGKKEHSDPIEKEYVYAELAADSAQTKLF